MFELFTDRARMVVLQAQEEARRLDHSYVGAELLEGALRESRVLGHHYVGTEHILLALIGAGDGVAGQVLSELAADLDAAREQVIRLLAEYRRGQGNQTG